MHLKEHTRGHHKKETQYYVELRMPHNNNGRPRVPHTPTHMHTWASKQTSQSSHFLG